MISISCMHMVLHFDPPVYISSLESSRAVRIISKHGIVIGVQDKHLIVTRPNYSYCGKHSRYSQYCKDNFTTAKMLNVVVFVCAVLTVKLAGAAIDERFFSPYVDATSYPIEKIDDISSKTGVKYFSLGFIVSGGDPCEPSWGGYYSLKLGPHSWNSTMGREDYLYDHIRTLRQRGGDIIVSFGGAAGTPLYGCTDDDKLYEALNQTQVVLNATYFDFDIEGSAITQKDSTARLAKALQRLQSAQSRTQSATSALRISLTLPVLPSGLTSDGLNVVNIFKDAGVVVDAVNVMAMDFGDSAAPPGQPLSYYVKQSMDSTVKQVGNANTVGVTPMIGMNDVTTERLTLDDADIVADYARAGNFKSIGMWSINRDHSCAEIYVDTHCSSECPNGKPCQSTDFQYALIFTKFASSA